MASRSFAALAHGHVAAVRAVIRKLGLERTLQGRTQASTSRVRNLIEAMIIQRIIAPGSKLAFHRALGAGDGNLQPRAVGRSRSMSPSARCTPRSTG